MRAWLILGLTLLLCALTNAAPIRLLTLGDGLTEGEGDTDDKGGYPGRIQRRASFPVLNLGHAGWTSQMILDGFDNKRSSLTEGLEFKPTIACLWVGNEDLWELHKGGDDPPPEDHYAQNIATILTRLRAANVDVYVTLLDDPSRRPVAQKRQRFPSMQLGPLAAHRKLYNDTLREQCRRHKCHLVDVTGDDLFRNPLTLAADGNNLNGQGYDIVTNRCWKALKPCQDKIHLC